MIWIRIAAILMFVGVLLGAFGAHVLKQKLASDAMQVYQTATLYHFIHALGLLAVGWGCTMRPMDPLLRTAAWSFLAGILLFSGSLYLLAVTGEKKLGMVAPLGGFAFMAGWICLALAARND